MAPRYKLSLRKLDFISIVDQPAQPNATCLLIKRATSGDEVQATARLVKTSDELGLAFFWAFTSTNADGTPHHDLQGDAISADNDMIKAAAAFMEQGGPADQQHDSKAIGKTVFAMPMTPEIAAAFGVVSKTSGLMIAIRPPADVLAKLKDGTYTGVSIAGLGERTTLEKSGVKKSTLYTTLVDGHQHTLDLEDGCWGTSYQTAEGADTSHNHRFVLGDDGTLTILADSGHTHELANGQAGVVMVPADAIVVVQNSAPRVDAKPAIGKSTLSAVVPHNENTMKLVVLTDSQHAHYSKLNAADGEAFVAKTQHAHYSKLNAADGEAFVAKTATERDAIVKAAFDADPVVYKTASGLEIRKSAGDVAVMLAKQGDEQAKTINAQAEALAKAENGRQTAEIEKRAATELTHIGKSLGVKSALLKAVDGIADEAVRKEVAEALKGANAAMKMLGEMNGAGSDGPSLEGISKFNAARDEFAKGKNLTAEAATVAFMRTPDGARLYGEANTTQAQG